MRLGGLAILTILAACLATGSTAAPQAKEARAAYRRSIVPLTR